MTVVPPALPGRACKKCLKQSHEFTCPLLAKADMRVVQMIRLIPGSEDGSRPHCSHSLTLTATTVDAPITDLRIDAKIGGGEMKPRFSYYWSNMTRSGD